jgi:hypothetical protein
MKYKRFILGLFFILLLVLLMFYNNLEYEKNDPKAKKYKLIFENIEEYNNTEISFYAQVKKINETHQKITVSIQEYPYSYPLIEIGTHYIDININTLKKGDLIEVTGILNGTNHVTAKKIFTQEQWKTDLIYLRSLPAIPFAIYLFLRTWRFNRKIFRFERRKKDA